jgi:hypothetical protein
MLTDLETKCAERDALSSWLGALEREGASLEAVRLVRAQFDRVLGDIARLSEAPAAGFGVTISRPPGPIAASKRIEQRGTPKRL